MKLGLCEPSDMVGDESPAPCEKTLSPSRLVLGRPVEMLMTGATGWMLELDRDRRPSVPSIIESGASSSSSSNGSTWYLASIWGVMRPWLMVRLCLCRIERRLPILPAVRSSWEMKALGERSASGCGKVVLETPLKGSGKPVSCCRLDSTEAGAVVSCMSGEAMMAG